MKLYEVKGTGKLQGMTVMSLDAFVNGAKPEKEMDESDISGLLHAAKNYNKSFLITADCDDGKQRTYRVRAQSERVAREKFTVHHAMAKIVSVKEEGVEEAAPALAKTAAGLALGGIAAAGAPGIVAILGPLVGIPVAAYGAYSAAKLGMKGVEKLWDMASEKLGGDDKVEQYATAQIAKLPPEQQQPVADTVKKLGESRTAKLHHGVVEGKEFGAYYYEQLAQKVFDQNPNLSSENEILDLGYSITKNELGARAQGVFRDEDFAGDFVSAYNWLKQQEDVTEGSKDGDRITIAAQGKGYIVYHSFDRDAYTARGVGEWKGQIEPEWFYTLADAEEHAEMEIAGHDEHYGKIDELTFKGSTCTKDCSGHEAGYNWYQRKGRVPNSHSKSFNKGADIAANESVNEAPGDFGLGANYRDIPDEEMQAFLDRTKNKEKTKRDKYDYPYVHASSIQIKNEEGREYDLDSLRKEIMTRPASILGQNAKMQHSETGTEAIFDIGLPALKGLAVNEKTGQFVVVDTCPGAGACKTYCYAMKGSYVMFKAVSMGLARMLNFLLNDPEGFKNKLNAEIAAARSKMAKKGARVVVRWHDAGDFFSPEYLDMAYGVARDNPDVGFYAYTKIADVATGDRPKNFNMNFSQGALSGQEKKVDFKRVKHSKVVPKDMFFDLVARKGLNLIKDAKGRMQFASPENLEDFKTRMAKHYAIDKDSILTYDQMMDTPVGDAPKWNVIVMPGDGDNSANRNDVIGSYLLFH
jgi:hypothetical protein